MSNVSFAYGGRRSGKTEWLVKRAAEVGGIIIVANAGQAQAIFKTACDLGLDIRYPITVKEHMKLRHSFYKGEFSVPVLIDELEWVLKAYGIYNLDSFTLDVSDLGALAGVMDEDEFRKACPPLAAVEHWNRRANDA